jgi:ABC-type molybdate transport system substrate-binding protein
MIPVCVMKETPHPKLAQKYIKFLLTEGKKIFAQFGFKVAE